MVVVSGEAPSAELLRFYASLRLTTGSIGVDRVMGGLCPPLMVVMPTSAELMAAGVTSALGCWLASEFYERRRSVAMTSGREWGPLLRAAVEHRALTLVRPGGLSQVTAALELDPVAEDTGLLRVTGAEGDIVRDLGAVLEAGAAPIDCWVLDDVTAPSGDLVQGLFEYGLGFEADLPILLRRLSRRRMCVVIAMLTRDSAAAGQWEEYADVMVQMEGARPQNDIVHLGSVEHSVRLQRVTDRFAEIPPRADHS